MSALGRIRERASYLPERRINAILTGASIVGFVVAMILDHTLHGFPAQVFNYVTVFLIGVIVTLMFVNRRR